MNTTAATHTTTTAHERIRIDFQTEALALLVGLVHVRRQTPLGKQRERKETRGD